MVLAGPRAHPMPFEPSICSSRGRGICRPSLIRSMVNQSNEWRYRAIAAGASRQEMPNLDRKYDIDDCG